MADLDLNALEELMKVKNQFLTLCSKRKRPRSFKRMEGNIMISETRKKNDLESENQVGQDLERRSIRITSIVGVETGNTRKEAILANEALIAKAQSSEKRSRMKSKRLKSTLLKSKKKHC